MKREESAYLLNRKKRLAIVFLNRMRQSMDGRFIVQNGVTRAGVVFGLSGFPSRKENGLLSSRAPRERNRTSERSCF